MSVKRLQNESGYSLVEVMVAIMLLGLAILPMVGMFDAGLRAAVLGSNYDQARALANEQLEEIKALPYKKPGGPADSVVELHPPVASPPSTTEGTFTYTITTRYVDALLSNPRISPPSPQMRVEVTVRWDGNDSNCGGDTKCYTTTGYVAGG
ncbi:hypothetical protein BH23ACT11_BH23ACT11_24390 [soil metagenome]